MRFPQPNGSTPMTGIWCHLASAITSWRQRTITVGSAEGFEWGGRFGADWEGAGPGDLPGQRPILDYVDDIETGVASWLQEMGDEQLLLPQVAFAWTGGCPLERALYVLRRIHRHVAELNLILRARGLNPADWR